MVKEFAAETALGVLLARAGIRIGGDRDWDMQVYDRAVFTEIICRGSLGLAESYIRGSWGAWALDEFFHRLLKARLDTAGRFLSSVNWREHRNGKYGAPTRQDSFKVAEMHYNLSADFFKRMLDRRMVYTCAYWTSGSESLEDAQEAKLEMVCRKLQLQPGESLLDVGCGWGSLAEFAAKNFGVKVVGVTNSEEQAAFARCRCAGLPVEILLQDYRDMRGQFDKIVSLGMFEHVEYKNHALYFDHVHRCLAPHGLFLLHTIGQEQDDEYIDPFIRRDIFPNGMIPGASETRRCAEKHFSILDWHWLGPDHYDRTLMAWRENFRRQKRKLDHEFFRMWDYYLSSCAGGFRAKRLDVWQIVMANEWRSYTNQR